MKGKFDNIPRIKHKEKCDKACGDGGKVGTGKGISLKN